MRIRKKIALLAVGLVLLILSIAGAEAYPFGSKVQSGDDDLGKPLSLMPSGTIFAFWDTGAPGYDQNDVVYLHIPKGSHTPDHFVNDNDVRLIAYDAKDPGSKVAIGDDDLGKPLKPFPGAIVRYMDQYDSTSYDLDDPVYLHQNLNCNSPSAFETINYDVRLTNVPALADSTTATVSAGTKIIDLDPDRNKLLGLTPSTLGPIAYFDKNGDGFCDDGDEIYVNYPGGGLLVKVNNVRLTEVI